MIRGQLQVLALSGMALVALAAPAQQGWSASQPITRDGKRATLNAVFYAGDEVWVVGGEGLIERSYDDGRTFQEADSGVKVGLNDVYARKDRVWVVGDRGVILVSTDGGRHFEQESYSSSGSSLGDSKKDEVDLYSLQFTDNDNGFVVGDRGLILASSDSGRSWRERKSGTTAQLFHLAFKGERGWVVGTGGTILHTDNSGETWYPQVSGGHEDLNRVYVVKDKVALITGDNGVLLRTDNWGATWERIALEYHEPLFGMSFVDGKTGWVVGYKGRITRTYDGGRSWVEQESGTETDLFSVSFHKNRGFAIGRDGLVLRYYERR